MANRTQTSRPFACRQCFFCKDSFRVDGGASGMESAQFKAWFCSYGCYNLARHFGDNDGTFNHDMRKNLTDTYNNCFTKQTVDPETGMINIVHVPKINAEKTRRSVKKREIYIVKGIYERDEEPNDAWE